MVSQPYISAKLLLLPLHLDTPPSVPRLTRLFDECAVDVALWSDAPDLELPGRRLNPGVDCLPASLCFSLSFDVRGTPSHFELTLGTVAGSLADDTPGIPTALTRPRPCFFNWRS